MKMLSDLNSFNEWVYLWIYVNLSDIPNQIHVSTNTFHRFLLFLHLREKYRTITYYDCDFSSGIVSKDAL